MPEYRLNSEYRLNDVCGSSLKISTMRVHYGSMFRFHSPIFFLLLIPWAILIVGVRFRRSPASVLFSDTTALKQLPRTLAQRLNVLPPWLFDIALLLLIIALARPQAGKEDYRIRAEGIALAMCVDRSGSMAATDFKLNGRNASRLEAVKKTFRDFVAGSDTLPGRRDDLIGLLAFGGYVDAFCPLTLDHDTLLEMLEQVNLIPPVLDAQGRPVDERLYREENMTAIGDALAHAVDRLKDVDTKSKVIILLSDGDQTFGNLTPQEGAEIAKAFGIKIYSIGIGSTGYTVVVETDTHGNRIPLRQYMVLDEETLKEVAAMTGGKYFNARNTQALRHVYEEIDQLEKTTHEGRVYTQYSELYRSFLIPATIMLVLHTVLVNTRFRRLP